MVRSRSGRETNGPTDVGQNARYIATLSCDTQPQVILLHPSPLCPSPRVPRSHSQSGSPLTHPFATSTLLGSPVSCSFGLTLVSPRSFFSVPLPLSPSVFPSHSVTLTVPLHRETSKAINPPPYSALTTFQETSIVAAGQASKRSRR